MSENKKKVMSPETVLASIDSWSKSTGSIPLTVMCHGVFDVVHPGHLEHFMQAKALGNILILSVTGDIFVNKGPGRPVFTQEVRANFLASIEVVDFVVISNSSSAVEMIETIKPHYYVKGDEYQDTKSDLTGKIVLEKRAVESYGGKLVFTGGFKSSSSKLINLSNLSLSATAYSKLRDLKERIKAEYVNEWLDTLFEVKPYVLGEFIVDEYSQCSALSKSSKDPLLAFEIHGTESFIGGAAAIAHNIGSWNLSCNLGLVMNQADSHILSLLESELPISVHLDNFFEEDFRTIRKHRFVDRPSRVRLFEYYDYNPRPISEVTSSEITKRLSRRLASTGPVIVADYGHGFFTSYLIDWLIKSKFFLAVNTQANAGNRGYNTISKYSRADFICLNGGELELELRKRNLRYEVIVPEIMKQHNARNALVTLGGEGMLVFGNNQDFVHIPALATNVLDRVGAGDAVLSIASLLSFVGAPIEVIGIIASVVAAHEVSQLGHKTSMSILDIKRAVNGVLA